MNADKLSVSLPHKLVLFLKKYQAEHAYRTQSEVIKEALKLLQKKALEKAYFDANQEIDAGFDSMAGDGLEDETW